MVKICGIYVNKTVYANILLLLNNYNNINPADWDERPCKVVGLSYITRSFKLRKPTTEWVGQLRSKTLLLKKLCS